MKTKLDRIFFARMHFFAVSLLFGLVTVLLVGCAAQMPGLLAQRLTENNFKPVSRVQLSEHAEWVETFKRDDGTQLNTRAWIPDGEIKGVVLCIHALSGHSGYFKSLGSALRGAGISVHALDLRGNGLSGTPGDIESSDQQITDIKLFVEYLHHEYPGKPLYLLGHSLGAGYVLKYAASFQDNINGIILMTPGVEARISLSPPAVFSILTMGIRFVMTPTDKWDSTVLWKQELKESELGKSIVADKLGMKEFSYRYAMTILDVVGPAMMGNAAKLKIPVLIMQGDQDTVVVAGKAKVLWEKISSKDKQYIGLEGADHDLYGLFFAASYHDLSARETHVANLIEKWTMRNAVQ